MQINIQFNFTHTNTNPNLLNAAPFMSVARVLDALKPHRAEALQRVRTNTFFLILLVVLSYLLPLPTVPSAFSHALLLAPRASESIGFGRTIISSVPPLRWSFDAAYTWLCTIGESMERGGKLDDSHTYNAEAFAVTIFLFNITQGVYALKYPHSSSSPTISPAGSKTLKSKTAPSSTSPNRHPFRPLSSPKNAAKSTTPQKPFTFSPTQSHSTSGPPGSLSSSSIGPLGLGKGGVYPSTPADSPSRGSIQYTLPPLGLGGLGDTKLNRSLLSSGASMGSSTSTQFPASPTPVVAAWRGRHMVGEIGRPLDGSFLGQICVGGQDEIEERERDE